MFAGTSLAGVPGVCVATGVAPQYSSGGVPLDLALFVVGAMVIVIVIFVLAWLDRSNSASAKQAECDALKAAWRKAEAENNRKLLKIAGRLRKLAGEDDN